MKHIGAQEKSSEAGTVKDMVQTSHDARELDSRDGLS